jgi:predicted ATPase/transcriptional regulator with XRE-family HTH domain/Tfp pilus assembly protein PilF
MSDTNLPFGKWLKLRRAALDMNQNQLAKQSGCSIDSVRKIEAGTLKPSRQLAELMAEPLEIAPEQRQAFVDYARGVTHFAGTEFEARSQAARYSELKNTNLHAPTTSFVGREKEVKAACDLLLEPEVRLVCMTGPGGTGKTRLAQEVAVNLIDSFASGVYLVSLAEVNEPGMVLPAVARTFKLRESAGETLPTLLTAYLKSKRMLLLLDNFEQVARAAPALVELLAECPGLKMLVTSRTRLQVEAERVFPVPPLDMPDPARLPSAERLARYEAVRLFIERAHGARADFDIAAGNVQTIARICARLDGLPLALELAAARTRILPPDALLERLDSSLNILTSGPRHLPPRQQTLRNAIRWSYDLLSEEEQTLFRRLALFVGGTSLEAAERILEGDEGELQNPKSKTPNLLDGLESLMDSSLLRQEVIGGAEPRFWMLETIREYGLERLAESGEAEALAGRHAEFFCGLAEKAEGELQGTEQGAWLARLEREHGNVRAAIASSLERGDVDTAARICGALRRFWYLHGHLSEGRGWIARVLARGDALPAASRAKALHAEAVLAWSQGDHVAARESAGESLQIWQALGDRQGVANMLHNLAVVAMSEGDYESAYRLNQQVLAVFQELGERWSAALSLANLGLVALYRGDPAEARSHLEESLALRREVGDRQGVAQSLNNLGTVMRCVGDPTTAYTLHDEALGIFRQLSDRWSVAVCLANMGLAELNRGEYEQARTLLEASLETFRELGVRNGVATSLNGLGGVAAQTGEPRQAALLFGAAEALLERVGAPLPPPEREERDRNGSVARLALGETEFARAWAEGRLLGPDRALASSAEGQE